MKVLSVYLKLSSEKKVKTKLFFCTRHLQRDVIIKKKSAWLGFKFYLMSKRCTENKKIVFCTRHVQREVIIRKGRLSGR